MQINITLTEEQAKNIRQETLTELTLEEVANDLLLKLVKDKEYEYEKNMELVQVISKYLTERDASITAKV